MPSSHLNDPEHWREAARHSQSSRNPFHAGHVFRGFLIHAFATAYQLARSPVRIRPIRSAPESFYLQASNGRLPSPLLDILQQRLDSSVGRTFTR